MPLLQAVCLYEAIYFYSDCLISYVQYPQFFRLTLIELKNVSRTEETEGRIKKIPIEQGRMGILEINGNYFLFSAISFSACFT
jgi:hypothetical protein